MGRKYLSEAHKQAIRELCQRHKVGMVDFYPDGKIVFTGFKPLKEAVESVFPPLVIIDYGTTFVGSKKGYWLVASFGEG